VTTEQPDEKPKVANPSAEFLEDSLDSVKHESPRIKIKTANSEQVAKRKIGIQDVENADNNFESRSNNPLLSHRSYVS